jgi:hypothetical protein
VTVAKVRSSTAGIKNRKRLARRERLPVTMPDGCDQRWSVEFASGEEAGL